MLQPNLDPPLAQRRRRAQVKRRTTAWPAGPARRPPDRSSLLTRKLRWSALAIVLLLHLGWLVLWLFDKSEPVPPSSPSSRGVINVTLEPPSDAVQPAAPPKVTPPPEAEEEPPVLITAPPKDRPQIRQPPPKPPSPKPKAAEPAPRPPTRTAADFARPQPIAPPSPQAQREAVASPPQGRPDAELPNETALTGIGGSGVDPTEGGPNVELLPSDVPMAYWRAVDFAIRNSERYPSISMRKREQGTATIKVTVARNGRVIDAKVTKSTGHAALDAEARNMVLRLGRVVALPPEVHPGAGTFTFDTRFKFQLGE